MARLVSRDRLRPSVRPAIPRAFSTLRSTSRHHVHGWRRDRGPPREITEPAGQPSIPDEFYLARPGHRCRSTSISLDANETNLVSDSLYHFFAADSRTEQAVRWGSRRGIIVADINFMRA